MVLTVRHLDLTAAIALVTAFAMTPVVRGVVTKFGVIDRPNDRSSHTVPTPRSGGIAILAGFFLAVAVSGRTPSELGLLLITMSVIAITGLIDDVRGLDARLRLIVQCACAATIAAAGWLLAWPVATLIITVFWIVGVTNAFNFMDGINGIASIEGAVAGVTLAVLSLRSGDSYGAAAGAAIAGACCGFLPWNFPSARIFMGDVASGALGFVIAALVVRYDARGGSAIAAALPLLPFLLDTSVTLLRRASRREKLFQAHRTHFYQRLVGTGWSHAATTSLWAALALAGGAVALIYARLAQPERIAAVITLLVVHAIVAMLIAHRERASATA